MRAFSLLLAMTFCGGHAFQDAKFAQLQRRIETLSGNIAQLEGKLREHEALNAKIMAEAASSYASETGASTCTDSKWAKRFNVDIACKNPPVSVYLVEQVEQEISRRKYKENEDDCKFMRSYTYFHCSCIRWVIEMMDRTHEMESTLKTIHDWTGIECKGDFRLSGNDKYEELNRLVKTAKELRQQIKDAVVPSEAHPDKDMPDHEYYLALVMNSVMRKNEDSSITEILEKTTEEWYKNAELANLILWWEDLDDKCQSFKKDFHFQDCEESK